MAKRKDTHNELCKIFNESVRLPNYHQIVEYWVDNFGNNVFRTYYFPDLCSAESYCYDLSERRRKYNLPFIIYLNQKMDSMSDIPFHFEDD